MTHNCNLLAKIAAGICLFALSNQQVMAQPEDDGWNHSLAVYLWGASISGATSQGTGVDVDFNDILNNLEFAAMGSYGARKGKWSILADVIYLDVSADKTMTLIHPIGTGNTSLDATANLDLTGWVVQMAGGYELYDDGEGTTTDVVAGFRYLDLSTDLLLSLELSPTELGISVPVSASEDIWDAIIGMRGVISLGDRWFMPWGANVGSGDSDLTWQAMAGVGFKASSWADIALTYRYLTWEFDDKSIEDLTFSGPLLGVIFRF